jgi:hypothetical protein
VRGLKPRLSTFQHRINFNQTQTNRFIAEQFKYINDYSIGNKFQKNTKLGKFKNKQISGKFLTWKKKHFKEISPMVRKLP